MAATDEASTLTRWRGPGRRLLAAPLLTPIAVLGALACSEHREAQQQHTLRVLCCASEADHALYRAAAAVWARRTGHRVELVVPSAPPGDPFRWYAERLEEAGDQVDVVPIDMVWVAALAPHLLDLGPAGRAAARQHVPVFIENDQVDGRLVALPCFASVGLLYYRRDLLVRHGESVPETWEQLGRSARRIRSAHGRCGDRPALWGYVWQGSSYEGLTCNALEWIASYGGGESAASGELLLEDGPARSAFTTARSWLGDLSPPGVLSFREEEAMEVFRRGAAIFMRNWSSHWGTLEAPGSAVRGVVGVARLPRGAGPRARHPATLGGFQLAVSRHSPHPELAISLVLHLTGADEQRRRALAGARAPTMPALYRDPEILAASPVYRLVAESLDGALRRPVRVSGRPYPEASPRMWSRVAAVLRGADPAAIAPAAPGE